MSHSAIHDLLSSTWDKFHRRLNTHSPQVTTTTKWNKTLRVCFEFNQYIWIELGHLGFCFLFFFEEEREEGFTVGIRQRSAAGDELCCDVFLPSWGGCWCFCLWGVGHIEQACSSSRWQRQRKGLFQHRSILFLGMEYKQGVSAGNIWHIFWWIALGGKLTADIDPFACYHYYREILFLSSWWS